jgi:phage gp46-like protein
LPNPEILAVTPVGEVSYQDENGWWNKVTNEDRAGALEALVAEARKQGEQGPLLDEAKEMAGSRLTDLSRAKKIRLQVEYPKP